jgi:hypothetical protein
MKQQPIRRNQIFLACIGDNILAFRNLKILVLFYKKEKVKFSYFTLRDKFQESVDGIVDYCDVTIRRVTFNEDGELD